MTKFDKEALKRLHYWVQERQRIADRKAAGKAPPWSPDPIMANTRWCNVRRMDDKVSKWLLDSWYPTSPKVKGPQVTTAKTIMAAVGLARLFNWPDSLDGLRAPRSGVFTTWDKAKADEHFHKIKATKGGKVFTGVYIINGALGGRGSDKIETILGQIDKMYNAPHLINNLSMRLTSEYMQQIDGIGSFMSGQFVADLRHVWPGPWVDRDTWAPLGPGSNRGMAWLTGWNGTDDLPKMKQDEFVEKINDLKAKLLTDGKFAALYSRLGLEMHDIQNVLCETDKYNRILSGTGKARNGYRPLGL